MEIQEVRVDNYVYGEYGKIHKIKPTDIVKLSYDPDCFYGIPLTQEILKQLGFSGNEMSMGKPLPVGKASEFHIDAENPYEYYTCVITQRRRVNNLWDTSWVYIGDCYCIHHIQNLWYQITEEELEWNVI